jgi:hypothetical protein
MIKGIIRAILGAYTAFFTVCSITPAVACDVQIGRPNSCNQYCDGDLISGPEVMSCSDYVRRKREAAAQATRARQDQIDRENRKADAERQRRQQVQDDRIEAERRRQADLDYAKMQQELATQKLDLKYYFGYDLKGDVTLAEWPLFMPAFGGVVVAAVMYRYG